MKQCLIVDDSRVIRAVASNILQSLEFEVCEAEDGVQGLDLCRARMPDVILFDMQMPSMTGMEFVRTLRREPHGARPFVVLSTIENDALRLSEVLNAGADEYVMKPFDRDSLASKLARLR